MRYICKTPHGIYEIEEAHPRDRIEYLLKNGFRDSWVKDIAGRYFQAKDVVEVQEYHD